MSQDNAELIDQMISAGVAYGLAQELSKDPWVTTERVSYWQQYAQNNPGITKPGGFIANQLKGHAEPPRRERDGVPTDVYEFWEKMRNDPEFRKAYCEKWGIQY